MESKVTENHDGGGAGGKGKASSGGQRQKQQRHRKKTDATTVALLATSLLVALVAVFWPQLSPQFVYIHRLLAQRTGVSSSGAACPLVSWFLSCLGRGVVWTTRATRLFQRPRRPPGPMPPAHTRTASHQGYTSANAGGVALPADHPPVHRGAPSAAGAPAAPLPPRGLGAKKTIWFRAGEIWTGDAAAPRATVMAVDAIGGEVLEIGGKPGAGEEVVDLGAGAFVMPVS
jgi:hypothetical protein